ncbi:MAG: patatin-like phospholipase family protein [Phycisphaerales bacterium JB039]
MRALALSGRSPLHRAAAAGAALWLFAVLIAGCTVSRPARSEEQLAAHRAELVEELIEGRERLSRKLIARMIDEQDQAAAGDGAAPVIDYLILSGGGDYGAFGAGVLKGWGTVTQPGMERPVFDVVSGVSTGALIAPLAFVGTEEAYERAFQVYQNPKPEWSRLRGLLTSLITKASLAENDWLRREIQAAIDDDTIRAIAEGHAEDRTLVIGTTNVDLGLLVMWDGALRAHEIVGGAAEPKRLHDIILASAALPAVFPPVEIDGDLYVDGGVTRNIAYTTDQGSPVSMVNIWKREHGARPLPKTRIWVIINNQLSTRMRQVSPGWDAQLGRSLELSIRSSTISALKGLRVAMELLRVRDGIDVEFRYLCIPDEWRPPVEGTFKKETMVSLAQLGYRLGADPASWQTVVPDPESPEPVDPEPDETDDGHRH